VQTDIINIALNYKYILYTEVTYINCLAGSLNIFIDKTSVFSFSILFACPSIDKYYIIMVVYF